MKSRWGTSSNDRYRRLGWPGGGDRTFRWDGRRRPSPAAVCSARRRLRRTPGLSSRRAIGPKRLAWLGYARTGLAKLRREEEGARPSRPDHRSLRRNLALGLTHRRTTVLPWGGTAANSLGQYLASSSCLGRLRNPPPIRFSGQAGPYTTNQTSRSGHTGHQLEELGADRVVSMSFGHRGLVANALSNLARLKTFCRDNGSAQGRASPAQKPAPAIAATRAWARHGPSAVRLCMKHSQKNAGQRNRNSAVVVLSDGWFPLTTPAPRKGHYGEGRTPTKALERARQDGVACSLFSWRPALAPIDARTRLRRRELLPAAATLPS